MTIEIDEIFPLSKFKKVKGTRHIMREKIIQILSAYEVSDVPWTVVFNHIFFREFNFGDEDEANDHLLKPDEIIEIDSDVPIDWAESEIEYAHALLEFAVSMKPKLDELLNKVVSNWEVERLAFLDKLIIQLAIAELVHSPLLPVKVTINEAIELAKEFSTHKSGTFINGVLDKIIDLLNAENAINKSGKGLK